MVPIAAGAGGEGGGIMRANTASRLYLAHIAIQVTKATVRQRRYDLERFLLHLGAQTAVAAVTRKHVEGWVFSLEVAPSTLKLRFLTIRSFFDFCVRQGWAKINPTQGIVLPRVPKKQPRALTRAQLVALGAALPDERARLIIALATWEGLRRVEIARLELGDIDFDTMTLRVQTAKANSEDLIPLSRSTHDQFLLPYLTVRGRKPGALIQSHYGGGLSPDTIGILAAQWMKEAGIKESPFDGRSLHACRHTFAMTLLDNGADPTVVQAGLRHSTLGSTWTYLRGQRDVERLRPYMGRLAKEAS